MRTRGRGTSTSLTIIAAGAVCGAVRKLLWQGLPMQTIVSWQPGWKSSIQARSAAEPWDPPPVMAAAKLLQSKAPEAARWRKVNQPPAAFSSPQWTRDRRSMPPQAYTYPDSFLFTSVAERHGLLWQGAGAEMRGLGSPAWCRPSCPISRRCRPARLEQLARQKKASRYSAGSTAEVLGLLGVHPDDLANLRHRAAIRSSTGACGAFQTSPQRSVMRLSRSQEMMSHWIVTLLCDAQIPCHLDMHRTCLILVVSSFWEWPLWQLRHSNYHLEAAR